MKPSFCAHCVEETPELKRCVRRGRSVWLCPDCRTMSGALRFYMDSLDRYYLTKPAYGGGWREGKS